MKYIPLTRGLFALVDDADYDWLSRYKWYAHHGGSQRGFYAVRMSARAAGRRNILMHCEIIGVKGIDHINHNGLDNRRKNLRQASTAQNIANQRLSVRSSSGFKGVSFYRDRQKWGAFITPQKNRIYLGAFSSPEAAARAYDTAAQKYFGEFACLNFPESNKNNNNNKPKYKL